jgi:hypothetical protein
MASNTPSLPHRLVLVRKPDLDTLMAALLAGVSPSRPMKRLSGLAEPEMLDDPSVLCLECGGSGRMAELNFDHHDYPEELPTATEQVWEVLGRPQAWKEWVDYTAWVDTVGRRGSSPPKTTAVTLSGLLSGLFLSRPENGFWGGLALIEEAVSSGCPPWDLTTALDTRPLWQTWAEARRRARRLLADSVGRVRCLKLQPGGPEPFLALSCPCPGVHGLLKNQGGVGRLAHWKDGHFTLSVDSEYRPWLLSLAQFLNRQEPGWGGPANGSILGSPFGGSRFDFENMISVINNFTFRF